MLSRRDASIIIKIIIHGVTLAAIQTKDVPCSVESLHVKKAGRYRNTEKSEKEN